MEISATNEKSSEKKNERVKTGTHNRKIVIKKEKIKKESES
jgi:hypothetical protein